MEMILLTFLIAKVLRRTGPALSYFKGHGMGNKMLYAGP